MINGAMKNTPRNNYALSAKTRRSKVRKHKNTPKGGAKNEQAELMAEASPNNPIIVRKDGKIYISTGNIYFGPYSSEEEAETDLFSDENE
jgi:hypothetical protein